MLPYCAVLHYLGIYSLISASLANDNENGKFIQKIRFIIKKLHLELERGS